MDLCGFDGVVFGDKGDAVIGDRVFQGSSDIGMIYRVGEGGGVWKEKELGKMKTLMWEKTYEPIKNNPPQKNYSQYDKLGL